MFDHESREESISDTSMLFLLNNWFVTLEGREIVHAKFDIPSYHQSMMGEAEVSSSISRSITCIQPPYNYHNAHESQGACSESMSMEFNVGEKGKRGEEA